MAKHIIIMLALCFMVYTVTAPASDDEQLRQITSRRTQFMRLFKCYNKMVENGLMRVKANLQGSDGSAINTFQDAVNDFYAKYKMQTIDEPGFGMIPISTSEIFSEDGSWNNKREEFKNMFVEIELPHSVLNGIYKSVVGLLLPFAVYNNPQGSAVNNQTQIEFCQSYSENGGIKT